MLKHGLFYLFAKLIPALTAFFVISVYTRHLSPEEYGLYALLIAVIGTINSLLFTWLGVSFTRFWATKKYTNITFISTITAITSVLLFLCSIITAIIIKFGFANIPIYIIVIAYIYLVVDVLFQLDLRLKAAELSSKQYSINEISASLLSQITGIILVWLGYGIFGILIAFIGSTFFVISLTFNSEWTKLSLKKVDKKLLLLFLSYGIPMSASIFISEISNNADKLMLAWLLDNTSVGNYSIVYNILDKVMLMLGGALNLAAFPIIIKALESKGKQAAQEELKKYAALFIGVIFPLSIGFLVLGDNLLNILLGEEFRTEAIILLPAITLATFLNCLVCFYFVLPFQLETKTTWVLRIIIIEVIANLLLNYFFIQFYGTIGAAIASALAYFIAIVLFILFRKKGIPIPTPWLEFIKIGFATFIMAGILYLLRDYDDWDMFILKIIIGCVSYITIAVILNIADIKNQILKFINKKSLKIIV